MAKMIDTTRSSPSRQNCKTLHDYLKTLETSLIDRLYADPACCMAVFRETPRIGQLFIVRLLFVEQPIPKAVVTSWVDPDHIKQASACGDTLSQLKLWREVQMPGGLPGWVLNDTFRQNMRKSLLNGGVTRGLAPCSTPDPHARSIEALDAYCLERWECVLHYMVGSSQQHGIALDAVRLLLHSGLMQTEADSDSQHPVITRQGFQFLLADTGAQVWHFVLHYLDTCSCHQLDLVECLCLLLQLGFSELGKDYTTDGMSERQLVFLQHLREFGLVYQRKRSSGRFYPTRLVLGVMSGAARRLHLSSATSTATVSATAGADSAPAASAHAGYLVVETNYRVYAYTTSDLQVALIGLFCEMIYRFPNLSVSILTRDSVRQALRSGITADQIIAFLRQYAHAEMRRRYGSSALPDTVVDQIRLWEMERNRFTFTAGVLYNQFVVQSDYEMLRNFARDRACLMWENSERRLMVVTRDGHDEVKKFWKRYGRSST